MLCSSRAGLAMSQDGRNWARIEAEHHTGAVLDAGEPGAWDAAFVGAPQVCRVWVRFQSQQARLHQRPEG